MDEYHSMKHTHLGPEYDFSIGLPLADQCATGCPAFPADDDAGCYCPVAATKAIKAANGVKPSKAIGAGYSTKAHPSTGADRLTEVPASTDEDFMCVAPGPPPRDSDP
jgi:hypothetical protein